MAKVKKEALTREELIEKMAECRKKLDVLVSQFNSETNAAAATKIEESVKEEKAQYNEYSQSLVLTGCLTAQNPTLEACRVSTYPAIAIRTKKEESGKKTMKIEDTTDLLDLTRFSKNITVSWRYRAELLCYFYTKTVASDIGKTDAEYQKDLAGFFKLSEEARKALKPSTRSLTTIIKDVVSQMIGAEYGAMVVAADIHKFQNGFTRDNAKSRKEILTANFRQTVKLLADICNRILTDGQYYVRSKQLTKDGKSWQDAVIAGKPTTKIADDKAPAEKKSGSASTKKSGSASAKKEPAKAPAEKKSSGRRSSAKSAK